MKIVTLPLFFLVYAKKNGEKTTSETTDFSELSNQQLITDASGKLKKLGVRAASIYVDYLGDWSRADNYRHKHDKMQNVLMGYLKKCGYQKGAVSQLKDDWEVPKRTTKSKDKKNKDRTRRSEKDSDVELPTLHKHLNSMASLWRDFEEDFEDDSGSDLVHQRGISTDGFNSSVILNDGSDTDHEAQVAYTKIRKLFNGYGIFSKMYLKECKKFSKVEKRISKTNERLVGAIGKFQEWQVKQVEIAEREAKKAAIEEAKALAQAEIEEASMTKEEKQAKKKEEKKKNKAAKAAKTPPPPEEDTFFG